VFVPKSDVPGGIPEVAADMGFGIIISGLCIPSILYEPNVCNGGGGGGGMISRWIVSFIESMMKVSGPSEGGSGGGGGGGGGFTFSMEALQTPGVPHIKLRPIQYKCMPFIGIKYRGLSERNATSNNNKNLVRSVVC
jgi:hypothetical protein